MVASIGKENSNAEPIGMQTPDFDLYALYAALDAQRQLLGLSWAELTRQINVQSSRQSRRALSSSTVKGIQAKSAVEGDGVLQMLRWLDRTPESFVPNHQQDLAAKERLPDVLPHQVLRFDTKKLYAALDEKRLAKNLTWLQAAMEIGVSASTLPHMSKGGRTSFPLVTRVTGWLGKPTADFTRASDW